MKISLFVSEHPHYNWGQQLVERTQRIIIRFLRLPEQLPIQLDLKLAAEA